MHIVKNLIMCISVLVLLTGCGRQEPLFVTSEQSGMVNDAEESADTDEVAYDSESSGTEPNPEYESTPESEFVSETKGLVAVYVCGAVKNPGVYYMDAGDIKDTAIRLAGGFTEDADTACVNLAQRVMEGERIYVPTKEETEQGMVFDTEAGAMQEAAQTESGKVNINTAGKEELMKLPGIGESKADAILAYRQEKGKFQSTDELMNIRGIKEGVYNKIKDLIVVN